MKTVKELGAYCSENNMALTYMKQGDGHLVLIEVWDKNGDKFYSKTKGNVLCQAITTALIDIKRIRTSLKKQNLLCKESIQEK